MNFSEGTHLISHHAVILQNQLLHTAAFAEYESPAKKRNSCSLVQVEGKIKIIAFKSQVTLILEEHLTFSR